MSNPTNLNGAPDINPLITGAEGYPYIGGREKALVLKDTSSLLGEPVQYPVANVFSKLTDPDNDGRNYQFPAQLGTEDAKNFMLFKIYNGHSEAYFNQERLVQEVNLVEKIQEQAQSGGTAGADAVKILNDEIIGSKLGDGSTVRQHGFEQDGTPQLVVVPPDGNQKEQVRLDDFLEAQEKELKELSKQERNWTGGLKDRPKTVSQVNSTRMRKANIRQKQTVALYMPHKLNFANFNTYETPDFKLLNEMKGLISSDVLEAGQPILKRKLAAAADGAAAVLGADLNLRSAIAAAEGRVENPRKETIYQSPELRKFEFSFEFTPRNLEESKSLWDIIRVFKHHAYPSLAGAGYYFNMPAEFELQFYSIINETAYENVWLNKIARCVLQEINVDYTAAGVFSTFNNGAPTNVNMTLTFQEVELITQEKVDQGY